MGNLLEIICDGDRLRAIRYRKQKSYLYNQMEQSRSKSIKINIPHIHPAGDVLCVLVEPGRVVP